MSVDVNQSGEFKLSNTLNPLQIQLVQDAIEKGKERILQAIRAKEQEFFEKLAEKQKQMSGVSDSLREFRATSDQISEELQALESKEQRVQQLQSFLLWQQEQNYSFEEETHRQERQSSSHFILQNHLAGQVERKNQLESQIRQSQQLVHLLQRTTGVFIEFNQRKELEISIEHQKQINIHIGFDDERGTMKVVQLVNKDNLNREVYANSISEFNKNNNLGKLISDIYNL